MTEHLPDALLARYVDGGPALSAELEWAVEAHLEGCADCRAVLAAVPDAGVAALLDTAWAGITARTAGTRPAPRRSRLRALTRPVPAMAPWMLSAVLVAVVAAVVGRMAGQPDGDAVLLVLAPVVPVLGVAVAWSRAFDPMHELTVAAPRGGLALLLWRTLLGLVLTVPLLTVASVLVGTVPLLWLGPGLVCALLALAGGSVVGVERATAGVGIGWVLVVGAPWVSTHELPVLPAAVAIPVGVGLGAVAAVVLVLRADAFGRLAEG
jgi:hypothetical protein